MVAQIMPFRYIILLSVILLTVQFPHSVPGQDFAAVPVPLPPAAEQALKEWDDKVRRSNTAFEKQKAELFDKYATALEREVQKYRTAGDLDTLLAVMKELEAAKKDRAISNAESPQLNSFRTTLQTMLAGFDRARLNALKEADSVCIRKLADVRVTLTQAGNLPAAQAVDQQIKSLENGNGATLPAKPQNQVSAATGKIGKLQERLDDDTPLEGLHVMTEGLYTLKKRVMVGKREDIGNERKFTDGTLRATPGAVVEGSSILVMSGALETRGSVFRHTVLESEGHGTLILDKSLFDQCTFGKGGSLVQEYFSTKWVIKNSVFHGSFIRSWRVRHIGVQITNCTFHDVDFAPVEFVADAGDEVKREWMKITNCKFVNCRIPESLLIVTNDCVFENCTFVPASIQIPIKKPIRTLAYLSPMERITIATPMISLETKDAALTRTRAGADISYKLKNGVLDF